MAVVPREGCDSVMGSTDVLGTVLAASIESGIVIGIHLGQWWLFVQWCYDELVQLKLLTLLYDCCLGRHTHSRSSKTGTVIFSRSTPSELSLVAVRRNAACGFSNEILI